MATHTQLPIYKVAYDLLDVVTSLVKNMQRDFKRSIGEKISAECIEITVLIFRANVAQEKAPHLLELIERLQVAEFQRQAEENRKWWRKYNESKRALKEENQLLTKQRDDMLAGLKAARFHLDGQAHCDATRIIESIETVSENKMLPAPEGEK